MSMRIVQRVVDLLAITSGWLLVGLSLLVAFEVVARKFFGFSIQGADEIGGYTLAIVSTIGFSYALVERSHIRIDLVHRRLPTSVQVALNLVALSLLSGFALTLAWRAVAVAWQSAAMSATAPTPLQTPLVVPQGIWSLALLVFSLIGIGYVVRTLRMALSGRMKEAASTSGIIGVEDSVAVEISEAKRRSSQLGLGE